MTRMVIASTLAVVGGATSICPSRKTLQSCSCKQLGSVFPRRQVEKLPKRAPPSEQGVRVQTGHVSDLNACFCELLEGASAFGICAPCWICAHHEKRAGGVEALVPDAGRYHDYIARDGFDCPTLITAEAKDG